MGRRGPAPTPTSILKLRGSMLVTKRRERSEAKGPHGRPRCPDWLDADAKAIWRQLVPQLELMGVLTKIDALALGRYCRMFVEWRKADAFISERGQTYPLRGDDGKIKCLQQFPQVGIANKLSVQLTRLEQEFGMTPSARTRIHVAPPVGKPEKDISHYFDCG